MRELDARGETIVAVADGHDIRLSREDVEVSIEAKPGFAAASERIGVVVLDTTLTQDLVHEGWFREVLSKVQARRKELALDFVDRIRLQVEASPALRAVIEDRAADLAKETLSAEVVFSTVAGDHAIEGAIEGETLRFRVEKVSKG
ncbi:MAG: hypothetical protein HC923_06610 [Myxococcales bacterium]|nr:hypothetical protein [Myxococcales bacterium]